MTGIDPTITIPSTMIRLAAATRYATHALPQPDQFGRYGNAGGNSSLLGGGDAANRVAMYTPNPFEAGSSISHWDRSASRNLLMEPFSTATLTLLVDTPQDLTFPMFRDLGW